MADNSPHEVTQLLMDWSGGDRAALDKLVPLVERELHRLAHHYMNRERVGHTLQTTALVNEEYVRLVGQSIDWRSRAHFFGIAARVMRQILVDYARKRHYAKRGGNAQQVSLDEAAIVAEGRATEIIVLDEALRDLAAIAPEQTRIVELKFFGGLTNEETAEVMALSVDKVKRDWSMAKTWLYHQMKQVNE
ncbi:MAG: sigma-70 family RNA polymerase sigma factor [Acidobacteriota bacterium]